MNRTFNITIGGDQIPIQLIMENRSGPRVALGSKEVIMRFPVSSSNKQKDEYFFWAKSWLMKLYDKKPALFKRYQTKPYRTGDFINTTQKRYILDCVNTDTKSASAKIIGETIQVNIPQSSDFGTIDMPRLLANVISKDQFEHISERVHRLNGMHFSEDINQIRLKYMISRWGSCSIKKNINLSSRLLKAPLEILDHVIIHELAHTKELNHSKRFWNWVKNADPFYQEHDRWLKKNGASLFF